MTQTEFENILNENRVIFMFIHAEWCGPCKAMIPMIDEITNEYKDKVKVIDIDVEENDDIVARFKIRNVPTLIFIKDKEQVHKIVGSTTKENIVNSLNDLIG